MAKKQIASGLNGLLTPTTSTQEPAQEQETNAPVRGDKKVVSFSATDKNEENLRYVAHYDRKTISAVINEALAAYFSTWTPAPQEKPRKL